ncbi:hypothetical protein EVAR_9603_1 [Eumeta japonica]|uniref:Pre-C2HC domain-containing protein n=1 Tax=Eumeta variegata TaxID=151549 RepID=A0A4C1TML9_EUMVA|nr:hypothetical protein EVAR_9603_1 [Eumeta japonica]
MDNANPCPPRAGGISKGPLTRALIKEVLAKSLAEMEYECPDGELNKFVRTETPVSSRASSNTASSASSQNSSRSQFPLKGKTKEKPAPRRPRKTRHARIAPSSAWTVSPSPTPPAPRPPPPRGRLDPGPAHSPAMTTRWRLTQPRLSQPLPKPRCAHLRRPKGRSPPPRSLNKYLVDFKVQFHTYALEEGRKIKVIIRGIPADFPVEEIKADLCDQGFPVLSVHRLCRRDGTPLWLVLAVLPRTEEAKNLSQTLNKVCGLSGIRVERLPTHTRLGGKTLLRQLRPKSYANYKGCPKIPKFSIKTRPNIKRPFHAPTPGSRKLSGTGVKKDNSCCQALPPAPSSNPWGRNQPSKVVQEPPRESTRRAPPAPPPATMTAGPSSFGDDIQTVMAVLRAVLSSEMSEFAGQLRACCNVDDEKFQVLVRPRACAIADYVQLQTDRSYARRGGTALYYSRSLHCCPLTIPPLINMESTGCRLIMRGHRTIAVVSVYLPSAKPLLRSDLRALLALGDAVILFGDFNCKKSQMGLCYNGSKWRKTGLTPRQTRVRNYRTLYGDLLPVQRFEQAFNLRHCID